VARGRRFSLSPLLLPLMLAACSSGVPATATATKSSSSAAVLIDSCLVGTWTATNVAMSAGGISGFAGMTMTIQASGKTVLDLSNAAPMVFSDKDVSDQFTGTDTFTMDSVHGQTGVISPETSLNHAITGLDGTATEPLEQPFFDAALYTCSSTSLTMNFDGVVDGGAYLEGYAATFTR
jgi:hypothetical protein